MTFWILTALLAGAVALLLGMVLLRGRVGDGPAVEYDLKVYRDQLKEVERDVARGVVAPADAERVRTEISRRILAADAQAKTVGAAPIQAQKLSLTVGLAIGLALVAGSLLLYRDLGAPGYGDLSLKRRIEMAQTVRAERPRQAQAEAELLKVTRYMSLVQRLREVVATRPDDLQGHVMLARYEAWLENFAAAYQAQSEVVRLKGPSAEASDYTDLADMMILAAGGYVSPEAESVLESALQRDPANGVARYYLGLMLAQTGRPDQTFQIWSALLRQGPPDAPWSEPILAQMEEIAFRAGTEFTPPSPMAPPQSGPSAADVEAASQMSEEERMNMIRGMVQGLAERLAEDGGPPQDWARLIGALGVLGETERARAIHANALEVFAGNADALDQIDAAARRSGLIE